MPKCTYCWTGEVRSTDVMRDSTVTEHPHNQNGQPYPADPQGRALWTGRQCSAGAFVIKANLVAWWKICFMISYLPVQTSNVTFLMLILFVYSNARKRGLTSRLERVAPPPSGFSNSMVFASCFLESRFVVTLGQQLSTRLPVVAHNAHRAGGVVCGDADGPGRRH